MTVRLCLSGDSGPELVRVFVLGVDDLLVAAPASTARFRARAVPSSGPSGLSGTLGLLVHDLGKLVGGLSDPFDRLFHGLQVVAFQCAFALGISFELAMAHSRWRRNNKPVIDEIDHMLGQIEVE